MTARPTLFAGDCRETMAALAFAGERFDAVVTDPPYGLTSMHERFGKAGSAPPKHGRDGSYARLSGGFMGAQWDGQGVEADPETWRLAADVLKTGGHLLAFAAPRTYHRIATAIEAAGFEIFDSVLWLYGQGWPKRQGLLKPAHEPICVARKRDGRVLLDTEACRIPLAEDDPLQDGVQHDGKPLNDGSGWGFKAADREPGKARWPANVVHDGSDDVVSLFPNTKSGSRKAGAYVAGGSETVYGERKRAEMPAISGDSGSAARYFYCAKATAADRAGSKHPTVKPLALMRWLCRLVCPPGGRILDPFAGSGTTLQAAYEEGFAAFGCEREPDYIADIERRLASLNCAPRVSEPDTDADELAGFLS